MLNNNFLAGQNIYVSTAHTKKIIQKYLTYMNRVFKDLAKLKKIMKVSVIIEARLGSKDCLIKSYLRLKNIYL